MSEDTSKRDYLARERTRLANERTFLAYTRTSLAFLVLGTFLLKFLPEMDMKVLAFISIDLGFLIFILGSAMFLTHRKKLKRFPLQHSL